MTNHFDSSAMPQCKKPRTSHKVPLVDTCSMTGMLRPRHTYVHDAWASSRGIAEHQALAATPDDSRSPHQATSSSFLSDVDASAGTSLRHGLPASSGAPCPRDSMESAEDSPPIPGQYHYADFYAHRGSPYVSKPATQDVRQYGDGCSGSSLWHSSTSSHFGRPAGSSSDQPTYQYDPWAVDTPITHCASAPPRTAGLALLSTSGTPTSDDHPLQGSAPAPVRQALDGELIDDTYHDLAMDRPSSHAPLASPGSMIVEQWEPAPWTLAPARCSVCVRALSDEDYELTHLHILPELQNQIQALSACFAVGVKDASLDDQASSCFFARWHSDGGHIRLFSESRSHAAVGLCVIAAHFMEVGFGATVTGENVDKLAALIGSGKKTSEVIRFASLLSKQVHTDDPVMDDEGAALLITVNSFRSRRRGKKESFHNSCHTAYNLSLRDQKTALDSFHRKAPLAPRFGDTSALNVAHREPEDHLLRLHQNPDPVTPDMFALFVSRCLYSSKTIHFFPFDTGYRVILVALQEDGESPIVNRECIQKLAFLFHTCATSPSYATTVFGLLPALGTIYGHMGSTVLLGPDRSSAPLAEIATFEQLAHVALAKDTTLLQTSAVSQQNHCQSNLIKIEAEPKYWPTGNYKVVFFCQHSSQIILREKDDPKLRVCEFSDLSPKYDSMACLLLNAHSLSVAQKVIAVLVLPGAAVHGDALCQHLPSLAQSAAELHTAILGGAPGYFVCFPADPMLQVQAPWSNFPKFTVPSPDTLWKWLWSEEQAGRWRGSSISRGLVSLLYLDVSQRFSTTLKRLLSIAHSSNVPLLTVLQACETGIGPSIIGKVPVHLELSQLEFGRIGIGLSHEEAQRTLQHVFHNALSPSPTNLVWPRASGLDLSLLIISCRDDDWIGRAALAVHNYGLAILLDTLTKEQVQAYVQALQSLPCDDSWGNREANRLSLSAAFGPNLIHHEPFPSIIRDTLLGDFLDVYNTHLPYDEHQLFATVGGEACRHMCMEDAPVSQRAHSDLQAANFPDSSRPLAWHIMCDDVDTFCGNIRVRTGSEGDSWAPAGASPDDAHEKYFHLQQVLPGIAGGIIVRQPSHIHAGSGSEWPMALRANDISSIACPDVRYLPALYTFSRRTLEVSQRPNHANLGSCRTCTDAGLPGSTGCKIRPELRKDALRAPPGAYLPASLRSWLHPAALCCEPHEQILKASKAFSRPVREEPHAILVQRESPFPCRFHDSRLGQWQSVFSHPDIRIEVLVVRSPASHCQIILGGWYSRKPYPLGTKADIIVFVAGKGEDYADMGDHPVDSAQLSTRVTAAQQLLVSNLDCNFHLPFAGKAHESSCRANVLFGVAAVCQELATVAKFATAELVAISAGTHLAIPLALRLLQWGSNSAFSSTNFSLFLFAPGLPLSHLHVLHSLTDCMFVRVFCCQFDEACPVGASIGCVAPKCTVDLASLHICQDDLIAFLGTNYHNLTRLLRLTANGTPAEIPPDGLASKIASQCDSDMFLLKSLSPSFAVWTIMALLLFSPPSSSEARHHFSSYVLDARIDVLRQLRSLNVVWRTLTTKQSCCILNDHLPWSHNLAVRNWNSLCKQLGFDFLTEEFRSYFIDSAISVPIDVESGDKPAASTVAAALLCAPCPPSSDSRESMWLATNFNTLKDQSRSLVSEVLDAFNNWQLDVFLAWTFPSLVTYLGDVLCQTRRQSQFEYFVEHVLDDGTWQAQNNQSSAFLHITDSRQGDHFAAVSFAIVDATLHKLPLVFAPSKRRTARGSFGLSKGDLFFLELKHCTITFQIYDVEDEKSYERRDLQTLQNKHSALGSAMPYTGLQKFEHAKTQFAFNTPARDLGTPAQACSRNYKSILRRCDFELLLSLRNNNLLPLRTSQVWCGKLRISSCDLVETCPSYMRFGERIPQLIGTTGFSSTSLNSLGRSQAHVVTPITFFAALGLFTLSTTAPAEDDDIYGPGTSPTLGLAVKQVLEHRQCIYDLFCAALSNLTQSTERVDFIIGALRSSSVQELSRGLLHHICQGSPVVQFCAAPGTGKTFAGQALCLLVLAAGDILGNKGILGTQRTIKGVSHTNTAVMAMAQNLEKLAGPSLSTMAVHLLANSAQHDFPPSQRTAYTKVSGETDTISFFRQHRDSIRFLLFTLGLAARQPAFCSFVTCNTALLVIDEATKNSGLDSILTLQGCPNNLLVIPIGDTNQLPPHVSDFGRDTNKLYRDPAHKHLDSQVLMPDAVPLPEHSSLAAIGELNLRNVTPSREAATIPPWLQAVADRLGKPPPTYVLNDENIRLVADTLGDSLACSAFCSSLGPSGSTSAILQVGNLKMQLPKPVRLGTDKYSATVVISANTRTAQPLLRLINAGVAPHLYMQAGPEHIRPSAEQVTVLIFDVRNHYDYAHNFSQKYCEISWKQQVTTNAVLSRLAKEKAEFISSTLSTEAGPILITTRWTRQVALLTDGLSKGNPSFFNDKICKQCKRSDLTLKDFQPIVLHPADHKQFFIDAGISTPPNYVDPYKLFGPFVRITSTFESQGNTAWFQLFQFLNGDLKVQLTPSATCTSTAMRILAHAMVDFTRARKGLLITAPLQQVIDAKLPGYSTFLYLCSKLGLVVPTGSGGEPQQFSLDNLQDADIEARLALITKSDEFRRLKFDSCMYEVALRKMLHIEDFYKYVQEDDMADTVIAELPDFHHFLLRNPDLSGDVERPGSSGFHRRASTLLKKLRASRTFRQCAALNLDGAVIIDGVVKIPFKGQGPDMTLDVDSLDLLLFHGTSWENMLSILRTLHIVRGGIHSRPAEGKHGVFAAKEAEQSLDYAPTVVFSDMVVQVLFLLNCHKAHRVHQLSGSQYVLQEHWFTVTHVAIRPVPNGKTFQVEQAQLVTREELPRDWRQLNFSSWAPLNELIKYVPGSPGPDALPETIPPPPSTPAPMGSPVMPDLAGGRVEASPLTATVASSTDTDAALPSTDPSHLPQQNSVVDSAPQVQTSRADVGTSETDDISEPPPPQPLPSPIRRTPAFFTLNQGTPYMQAPARQKFVKAATKASAWRIPDSVPGDSNASPANREHTCASTARAPDKGSRLLAEPLKVNDELVHWCLQTLKALQVNDPRVWWLRDAGPDDPREHSLVLQLLLNTHLKDHFYRLMSPSFFQVMRSAGLPLDFTSAILLHSSTAHTLILSETTDQLLVLLIGGCGSIIQDGHKTELEQGTAYPFTIQWTGFGGRNVQSEIRSEFNLHLSEPQSYVLVFFLRPQSRRPRYKVPSKHTDDLLYDAARYSLSSFAKTSVIQQWLVVDALVEHDVLLGLCPEGRTTLPHLFSRLEFRPTAALTSFETHLTGDGHQDLVIDEAIGNFLAYLCRRVSVVKRELFLREVRALCAAESHYTFAQPSAFEERTTAWQTKSFWTKLVRGLAINNTPLGSPLLGSWMSKKLTLKDPAKHSPADHRIANTVKDFLTDSIPGMINDGDTIQVNKAVHSFRSVSINPPHSLRIVVPTFIADELASLVRSVDEGNFDANDSWRPPLLSDLDLSSGDLREHSFARPLGLRRCEFLAIPTLKEEVALRSVPEQEVLQNPLLIQVEVEYGLFHTGVALHKPFHEFVPGTLGTTDEQLLTLRRLQLIRSANFAPVVDCLSSNQAMNADTISKIQLHTSLSNFAVKFHEQVRAPFHRSDERKGEAALLCAKLLNDVTALLRESQIGLVCAARLRHSVLYLIVQRTEAQSWVEIPSVIQALNLRTMEPLKFEATDAVNERLGLMSNCAFVLDFRFRDYKVQVTVQPYGTARPSLRFVNSHGHESVIYNFGSLQGKHLPNNLSITCASTDAYESTLLTLTHLLASLQEIGSKAEQVAAIVCFGLNLGGSPLSQSELYVIKQTGILMEIIETLLTAEVVVPLQGMQTGCSLSSTSMTTPIRAVALPQGILFPQHMAQHRSLCCLDNPDKSFGENLGNVQVELQSSGEATIFRILEQDTLFLTPAMTLPRAEEVQTSLFGDRYPPLATHVISFGAVSTAVKRPFPLRLQEGLGMVTAFQWFWLQLSDTLGANDLFRTVLELASLSPGNTHEKVTLRHCVALTFLLFRAEKIKAHVIHIIVLIHLTASQFSHVFAHCRFDPASALDEKQAKCLQELYCFVQHAHAQLTMIQPARSLVHLRLWYGALISRPMIAYDRNWRLDLPRSLRRVEETKLAISSFTPNGDELVQVLALSVRYCFTFFTSTSFSNLYKLDHFFDGNQVEPNTCKHLFAMGISPPWCLALARVTHLLGSNMPTGLQTWWHQHHHLLIALSDSHAMETFFNTHAMLSKSSTVQLLTHLPATAKQFLLSLRFALEDDLFLAAPFLSGPKRVPHNWSPKGLTQLVKSISTSTSLDRPYEAEFLRVPVDDWLHTFASILYVYNTTPLQRRIKAITNEVPGYFLNWHKLVQVLCLLPHVGALILDKGPCADWVKQYLVLKPQFKDLGRYQSLFQWLLATVFDEQHRRHLDLENGFLDSVFAASSQALIDQTKISYEWQFDKVPPYLRKQSRLAR